MFEATNIQHQDVDSEGINGRSFNQVVADSKATCEANGYDGFTLVWKCAKARSNEGVYYKACIEDGWISHNSREKFERRAATKGTYSFLLLSDGTLHNQDKYTPYPIADGMERLPLYGYGAAAVHALNGNDSEAKQAAARSTNGAVAAGGAMAAMWATGGMIIPAAVGGACAGVAGNRVQRGCEAMYNENDMERVGQEVRGRGVEGMMVDGAIGGFANGVAAAFRPGAQAIGAQVGSYQAGREMGRDAMGPILLERHGLVTPGLHNMAGQVVAGKVAVKAGEKGRDYAEDWVGKPVTGHAKYPKRPGHGMYEGDAAGAPRRGR